MTDDDDRTREIHRDGDRYRPAGQGDSTPPSAYRPQQQQQPQQGGGAYPPAGGGYRPTGQAQPYAAPMLPTDRGSGGFPAAIIGAVVATIVAAASSYAGYQILKNHSSIDPTKPLGFITYHLNMLPWPSGGGSDLTTAFVVGVLIVLVISVLLMMAAAMSTRAGTGGFALFLAAWMASVIAGGVARPVAGVIARHGSSQNAAWQSDLNTGVLWGVMFGWVAALVLVIVHALRRKPVTR
ncbi:hypothetical protein [Flexivirga alba]|uniref:Integral membrane protein n=1 Tax=Flexivirga alba TaxID=702742 RepID=A0ABW2AGT7_9MICO